MQERSAKPAAMTMTKSTASVILLVGLAVMTAGVVCSAVMTAGSGNWLKKPAPSPDSTLPRSGHAVARIHHWCCASLAASWWFDGSGFVDGLPILPVDTCAIEGLGTGLWTTLRLAHRPFPIAHRHHGRLQRGAAPHTG